jgi:hypothetical protein
MTWVVAVRSWNYAIALSDTQVTSARGPITNFGVMKVQGIAANAVAGFAGSTAIGLDILELMSQAAIARQRGLPANTRFAIRLPFYAMEFIKWLEPQYSSRYSVKAREQGLEMVILSALPVTEAGNDILADLTQGVKVVFPRPEMEQGFQISLLNLISPMSIGSGAGIEEYANALDKVARDRWDEFKRRLVDPDQYSRLAEFAADRARAITPLIEVVLRERPTETVGQQLICSVITPVGLFGPFFVGGWARNRTILNLATEVRSALRDDQQAVATLRA